MSREYTEFCDMCDRNEARYYCAHGFHLCGLCSLRDGSPSIRNIDLYLLLNEVAKLVDSLPEDTPNTEKIRTMMQANIHRWE